MSAADSFESLLEGGWDELPEDKVLPDGSYLLKTTRAGFFEAKEEGQNPQVFFEFKPIEPTDDVDVEELAELGDDYDIGENRISYTVFIERNGDFKKKVLPMLTKMGVAPEKGEAVKETLKRARGTEIFGVVGNRTYKDKKSGDNVTVNTVKGFKAIED